MNIEVIEDTVQLNFEIVEFELTFCDVSVHLNVEININNGR